MAHGDMGKELLENACVDAVIDGPGEIAVPRWINQGCPSGFFTATCISHSYLVPEYDDYFSNIPHDDHFNSTLLLEASRGCDYGACTFCAQNSIQGRFVYPADYIISCLNHFNENYQCKHIEFADTSLPIKLFKYLTKNSDLPALTKSKYVFAESRCLASSDMCQIAKAGFSNLQIGVESLSQGVLNLMKKDSTLLENICCLRESWNYGITLNYNIILDMPGTTIDDYNKMLNLLPFIHHLPPPTSLIRFQLQRNSPVFKHPERYNIFNIIPHHYHRFLNSAHPTFYYSFSNKHTLSSQLLQNAHNEFKKWELNFDYSKPLCIARLFNNHAEITDTRSNLPLIHPNQYSLTKEASAILKICRKPQPLHLIKQISSKYSSSPIYDLINLGLIIESDGFYATLPVLIHNDEFLPVQQKRDPIDSYFVYT
jgi:hypothetical protein